MCDNTQTNNIIIDYSFRNYLFLRPPDSPPPSPLAGTFFLALLRKNPFLRTIAGGGNEGTRYKAMKNHLVNRYTLLTKGGSLVNYFLAIFVKRYHNYLLFPNRT